MDEQPRFRLNIDVLEARYAGDALIISLQTMGRFPDQEIGSKGIIGMELGDKRFHLERNELSYTVREVEEIDEDARNIT